MWSQKLVWGPKIDLVQGIRARAGNHLKRSLRSCFASVAERVAAVARSVIAAVALGAGTVVQRQAELV